MAPSSICHFQSLAPAEIKDGYAGPVQDWRSFHACNGGFKFLFVDSHRKMSVIGKQIGLEKVTIAAGGKVRAAYMYIDRC